jgi:hypothetical protein
MVSSGWMRGGRGEVDGDGYGERWKCRIVLKAYELLSRVLFKVEGWDLQSTDSEDANQSCFLTPVQIETTNDGHWKNDDGEIKYDVDRRVRADEH